MNERDLELALRKQRLVLKSAALRVRIRRDAASLRPALNMADRVIEAGRWVRGHAGIVVGVATALVVVRPRAALRWARRGFVLWRGWRALRERLPL